jgi:hypothetical protein
MKTVLALTVLMMLALIGPNLGHAQSSSDTAADIVGFGNVDTPDNPEYTATSENSTERKRLSESMGFGNVEASESSDNAVSSESTGESKRLTDIMGFGQSE